MNTTPTHTPGPTDSLPADLRDWLRANAGLTPAEVVEGLQRDQLRRWGRGERVPAEAYLRLLAEAGAGDDDHALDLIYAEFLLRRQLGESPAVDEYRWRFPGHAERLGVAFALEERLAAAGPVGSTLEGRTDVGAGGGEPRPAAAAHGGMPRVEGYDILSEVGRGGMGVVYAARDLALGRDVAVKTLLPELAGDPRLAVAFDREARITARLPHPGVPPVHALGTLPDGRPFLALKLITGHTLAATLRDRPDPSADLPHLVAVFEQVCQAVGFAHSVGVIHRDLKPSNVMVGGFGEVQVMDWGLAKDLASRGRERPAGDGEGPAEGGSRDPSAPPPASAGGGLPTVRGRAKGTPGYMPPEQARGEWDRVDARADVFAEHRVIPVPATFEEAVRRINTSVVKVRVLMALDDAVATSGSRTATSILRATDPEPFRDAVREALAAGNDARVAELAAQPAALEQPPWFAACVGTLKAVPGERRNEILTVALEYSPGDFNLLMARGLPGRRQDAEWAPDGVLWFRAAVAARPDSAAAHTNLGAALKDNGQLDAAIAAHRTAIRLDPKHATAHNNLGIALYRKGDLGGAIAAYREAIRQRPTFGTAHTNLGNALRRKDDRAGALAAYREAVRVEPDLAAVHDNLGIALMDDGDFGGAVSCFREAVRLDPNDAGYRVDLGRAVARGGDPKTAIGHFRDAIRLDPKSAAGHYDLGVALANLRDFEPAVAAFREAIKCDPTFSSAHRSLGNVLAQTGDGAGAVDAWRGAVRLNPKDAEPHYNLGISSAAKGDTAGAIASYEAAIRAGPRYVRAYANLAGIHFRARNTATAVALLRDAVRIEPKYVLAHWNLGNMLAANGDFDGAIPHLEEAAKLDPKNAKYQQVLDQARRMKAERDAKLAPPPRTVLPLAPAPREVKP